MPEGEILATRVAFLELKDERRLIQEGYEGFAAHAPEERRAPSLPPCSHLALLRPDGPVHIDVHAFLRGHQLRYLQFRPEQQRCHT